MLKYSNCKICSGDTKIINETYQLIECNHCSLIPENIFSQDEFVKVGPGRVYNWYEFVTFDPKRQEGATPFDRRKTKEPQSQAPCSAGEGQRKPRSFWAKVQISGLLRRHRFAAKRSGTWMMWPKAASVPWCWQLARHFMHWALRQSTWWCAQGAALLPWPADWPAGAGMPCIPSLQQPSSRCGADVQGSAGTALPVLQGPLLKKNTRAKHPSGIPANARSSTMEWQF